ncbi:MAG: GNAT family N-acetyltransferase [Clostridia bacterium]|nr:GNAT family N-acetyltransferase [Clostridia bacterium]
MKASSITIRKFKPSDVDGLFEVLGDAEVMRYVEPPFTLEQTKAFVQKYGLCAEPKVFALICDKSKSSKSNKKASAPTADRECIGHIIYHSFEDEALEAKYGKGKVFELGFVIAKDFQHKGIATTSANLLINHSRAAGIKALVLECDPCNVASIRLAEKLGFTPYNQADSSANNLLTFVLPL